MTTLTAGPEAPALLAADTVHQAFELVAAATPDAVAVECLGRSLSYRELNSRSNRLAHRLRGLGVGANAPVALCLDRSPELVIALLAVLKAGGCYVALDPGAPAARRAALLADTGASVLITSSPLADEGSGTAVTLLLDGADPALDAASDTDPGLPAHGEQAVYIAYTSGSTGAAKGVVVPHRAVLRLVRDRQLLPIGPDDAVLQFAPVAFDASTLELWTPLLNGARLVVQPAGRNSPEEIADTVEQSRVTVMWLTAGLFHQMVEGPVQRLRGLRLLLAGGDVLSVAHVNRALAALPGVRLVNGYGPTENTTFTCCHPMETAVESCSVPVGTPVDGTHAYILTPDLRPTAGDEPGELHAAGTGLAHGYFGRPGQTAERFLPDPFTPEPGGRMYRTGDRARRTADGTIEFLGRVDQQVKIRGYRVEPGEVEAALLRHPEIGDAAVVAQDDPRGGRRLVAFFVAERRVPVPELRSALAGTLPSYLVPSLFVRLDELPLTGNGKVDRVELAGTPCRGRPDVDTDFRAAGSAMEQELARVWADLLEVDEIGVDDDFFELGGHSLLATRITAEISGRWGVEMRPRDFYENPTVAELAEVVQELRR
ncbi:amino acid adenylation domain-containing protein [Peterkaempfera sp. SMS 1(5)a]|uniref:amino acid adenylation domain-containing protein n=1 Tax=Peterkaempfera podocarpi TaxID=3232308 RepID=UPI0036711216